MTAFAGIAGEIEAVIGPVATAKLLAARGGTTIWVPSRAKGSMLAALIGEATARQMIAAFGQGTLTLPLSETRGRAARRQRALALLRNGASLTEVALNCDVHIRTVSRWKLGLKADTGSLGPLFDHVFDP
ncbi:MAG: helix-turn-helix domain-containing protein [Rhodobacter sp.]|nr:helix-turn-helix domain-containing protein [Rhodobacter sp.]